MTIGIPYAYGEVVDGKLVLTCPVCDARIEEATDEYGEETTSNYAKHYAEEHEDG